MGSLYKDNPTKWRQVGTYPASQGSNESQVPNSPTEMSNFAQWPLFWVQFAVNQSQNTQFKSLLNVEKFYEAKQFASLAATGQILFITIKTNWTQTKFKLLT